MLISITLISGLYAADINADFGAAGAKVNTAYTLEGMLKYAIEDEYLAKAEYELIISKYGNIRPFTNIIRSEEQHIAWLKDIYKVYSLPVPPDNAKDHVVMPENLKAAYETGVTAEIENIAMYERFLEEELPADVRSLFERLMNASKNHLGAFERGSGRY